LNIEMRPPRFPVISNVTGEEVKTLPEIRRTLQDQVMATVRWVDCMETLLEKCGCNFFIELGPGNVLAGLLRRISKGVDVISVGDSATVRACVEKLRAH
jgi:[acyl-carrier-protein] S-malonyltransferase